ncbi:MAG: outer membrane lipoprotein carrier protein LolA [Tenuifilaceae bacterium]|jgi:outer membrane lipoprotein-sorting protein|nr:outer membrane lipoprotein carrier protein LolA [Tenuifilaceae bacterium]
MRRFFLTAGALVGASILALGQSAPLGKDLIKSFSEKMQAYQTIQADFSFTLENLQEGFSDTHSGKLSFKGNKYSLDLMGMEVYFDGTTKWQFIPEANEVTISLPTTLDGGFLDDPTQIFRDYEQDFKSRFIGEKVEKGVALYEVDLYPEDLSEPYSLIKIIFKKKNLDPVSIKYQGKDGINYIIEVSKFTPNASVTDQDFVFNPQKHRGIEVVDLR